MGNSRFKNKIMQICYKPSKCKDKNCFSIKAIDDIEKALECSVKELNGKKDKKDDKDCDKKDGDKKE